MNAYFIVHPDQVVNDPTSQWGMLYGYPELTQFIVTHHLTGLPIYESTDGLFGNSTSYADFFYHTFQVPLSYLNYYSGGLITHLTLTNVSYFYTNQTSLILSGSSQDINTLRENGVNATVIDNITRPDGDLALTLIETWPGLLPPQASALDKTLFNAKPAPQSIYNLSSKVVLNESFSLSARFSIGIPPANDSTTFQNLVEVDYNPGTQLAGIRLAPATLQPGGGPSDVWTINAYIDTAGLLSDELWTSVLVAQNGSYVVTLTFSDGTAVVFVNNSAVLVTSVVPIGYSAGLLEIGSTAVPLLQEAKAWGIALTAAQVGYEYYNN